MSIQEMAAEIKRLTLDERLQLLNLLAQSISDELQPPPRAGSSLARVRGLLKPDGPSPTDAEVDELRFQSLTEKHR